MWPLFFGVVSGGLMLITNYLKQSLKEGGVSIGDLDDQPVDAGAQQEASGLSYPNAHALEYMLRIMATVNDRNDKITAVKWWLEQGVQEEVDYSLIQRFCFDRAEIIRLAGVLPVGQKTSIIESGLLNQQLSSVDYPALDAIEFDSDAFFRDQLALSCEQGCDGSESMGLFVKAVMYFKQRRDQDPGAMTSHQLVDFAISRSHGQYKPIKLLYLSKVINHHHLLSCVTPIVFNLNGMRRDNDFLIQYQQFSSQFQGASIDEKKQLLDTVIDLSEGQQRCFLNLLVLSPFMMSDEKVSFVKIMLDGLDGHFSLDYDAPRLLRYFEQMMQHYANVLTVGDHSIGFDTLSVIETFLNSNRFLSILQSELTAKSRSEVLDHAIKLNYPQLIQALLVAMPSLRQGAHIAQSQHLDLFMSLSTLMQGYRGYIDFVKDAVINRKHQVQLRGGGSFLLGLRGSRQETRRTWQEIEEMMANCPLDSGHYTMRELSHFIHTLENICVTHYLGTGSTELIGDRPQLVLLSELEQRWGLGTMLTAVPVSDLLSSAAEDTELLTGVIWAQVVEGGHGTAQETPFPFAPHRLG